MFELPLDEEEEPEPVKVVVDTVQVQPACLFATCYLNNDTQVDVRCEVRYVDLEGRSDARSVRTILNAIEPKRLVRLLSCLQRS